MSRPRTIAVVVGALALLIALTPLLPRGEDDDGALRPSGEGERTATPDTAGWSRVTPAMQAEIDRVVAAGRQVGRLGTKAGQASLARVVRCADLDGQRYCLGGVGWTDDSEQQARARVMRAARLAARSTAHTNTGDLDAAALLRRSARMSPAARARADRAELTMAARSVAKVWLLRHDLEGTPLPAGFLTAHPEARAARAASTTTSASPAAAAAKTNAQYPERRVILKTSRVNDQRRTYWCGPGSMQMIAWAWAGKAVAQSTWASRLGTTRSGTAITDMVRVVNRYTGWDGAKYAGPYITLDVGGWTYGRWYRLVMRHIADYRAPIVLHPALEKRFFPYLDDDASGHYQVGRGYDKRGTKSNAISYFEPWNQQRFDPSEPRIARVQWRSAYRSYRANQAHFLHNIGV